LERFCVNQILPSLKKPDYKRYKSLGSSTKTTFVHSIQIKPTQRFIIQKHNHQITRPNTKMWWLSS